MMMSLWLPVAAAAARTCGSIEPGTNHGTGYFQLSTTPTALECCELCTGLSECQAWDWATTEPHNCWLKDNQIGKANVSERISGLVLPPPPAPPLPFDELEVTATAWCADSIRLRVTAKDPARASPLTSSALIEEACTAGPPNSLERGVPGLASGNLNVSWEADGQLTFRRRDSGDLLFSAKFALAASTERSVPPDGGYYAADWHMTPGDPDERIYGLGQGGWSDAGGKKGGCASGPGEKVVPLERNGQQIELLQRKFHVSIPFAYSTAGYGFLFNMPGYGDVSVGARGKGGMAWHAAAAPLLDVWITSVPRAAASTAAAPIYERYADATGHAPLMREDLNTSIALSVAARYQALNLPVGVLVVDYFNMVQDGDFRPDPRCYPSLKVLSSGVQQSLNASVVFSIWPEAKPGSAEFSTLKAGGCLANSDLGGGGLAMDPTTASCRTLMWNHLIRPRYFDEGVTVHGLGGTSRALRPFTLDRSPWTLGQWLGRNLASFAALPLALSRLHSVALDSPSAALSSPHSVAS